MRRILLLHGYAQNATIFYKKMAAIRKQCGKTCEFVHAEAPLVLRPADLPQNLAQLGAAEAHALDSSNEASIDHPETHPELIARGWWLRGDEETMIKCAKSLLDIVNLQMEENGVPFDGVFGFSQGACAAALLAAMLEHPEAVSDLLKPSGSDVESAQEGPLIRHPPLRFCVLVAGFRPRSDRIDAFFDGVARPGIQTPSLHVLGVNDLIVGLERSMTLVDVCTNARVEKHEGGHFIPSKASWRQFFARYMTQVDDYLDTSVVPSPNPLMTTGSETSTPLTGMSRQGTP